MNPVSIELDVTLLYLIHTSRSSKLKTSKESGGGVAESPALENVRRINCANW
jgi:hypothetical protein